MIPLYAIGAQAVSGEFLWYPSGNERLDQRLIREEWMEGRGKNSQ
jgi:hypothetical protein